MRFITRMRCPAGVRVLAVGADSTKVAEIRRPFSSPSGVESRASVVRTIIHDSGVLRQMISSDCLNESEASSLAYT